MFLLAKICTYVITWHCPQNGDGCGRGSVLATPGAAEVVQVVGDDQEEGKVNGECEGECSSCGGLFWCTCSASSGEMMAYMAHLTVLYL